MKTLIFIILIFITTSLTSGEAFNNYRFEYNGKQFKMSQFIAELRASMPNKEIKDRFNKHIDAIIYYSLKRDLDPVLVLSIVIVESGLQNRAKSGVGARGLMQIMPATKEDIKKRILAKPAFKHLAPKNPVIDFDLDVPSENIDLGTIYIVYLMEEFKGDVQKVVIAYNMGPNYFSKLPKNFKHKHKYFNQVQNVYGKINKKIMGSEENKRSPASVKMAKM